MFYNSNHRLKAFCFFYFFLVGIAFFNPTLALYSSVILSFIIFAYYPLSPDKKLLIQLFLIINVTFNLNFFSSLSGPDEIAFYSAFVDGNTFDIINKELERLGGDIGFISSRNTYPMLLTLAIPLKGNAFRPEFIFLLNSMLWFYSISHYLLSIRRFVGKKIADISFILLSISPTVLLWMGNFGKDIFVMSLCILAASSFLNKHFIKFAIFLLIASIVRPYSIVLIVSFILPFRGTLKLCLAYLFSAAAGFTIIAGISVISVVNSFVLFLYLFFSPNPASANNWLLISNSETWSFSPLILTIEGVIAGCGLILALFFYFRVRKPSKLLMIKIMISIYVICIVMLLVGLLNLSNQGLSPSIGSLGDNFVRKKIVAWPLIAILIAIPISKFRLSKKRESFT